VQEVAALKKGGASGEEKPWLKNPLRRLLRKPLLRRAQRRKPLPRKPLPRNGIRHFNYFSSEQFNGEGFVEELRNELQEIDAMEVSGSCSTF